MSYYKLIREQQQGKAVPGHIYQVEHSKGCILVSAEDEQKLTAIWLKKQQNHEECRLEIC